MMNDSPVVRDPRSPHPPRQPAVYAGCRGDSGIRSPGVFFIGGDRYVAVDALRLYITKVDVVDCEEAALTPIRILDAIAHRQITIPRFKSRNAAPPPYAEMLLTERGDLRGRPCSHGA